MTVLYTPRRLIGANAPDAKLKFETASLTTKVDMVPYRGLTAYGPYDRHIRTIKTPLRLLVFYPPEYDQLTRQLIEGLNMGRDVFPGFNRMFHLDLGAPDYVPFDVSDIPKQPIESQADTYEAELLRMLRTYHPNQYDFCFVIVPRTPPNVYRTPYYRAKAICAASALPSQMVTPQLLRDTMSLRWSWGNIALQVYAKLGGKPWVLNLPDEGDEITVGIGQSTMSLPDRIGGEPTIIGFATLFKRDGNYLFWRGQAPAAEKAEYVERLTEVLSALLKDYAAMGSPLKRIVFHFFKRTSREEREAIGNCLSTYKDQKLEYLIAYLNRSSIYRLFDSSDTSYLPRSGFTVNLTRRSALLLSSGRIEGTRQWGVPQLIEVVLEDTNVRDLNFHRDVVNFSYWLTKMDWRSLRPQRSEPASIKYARLIARLVRSLGKDKYWNEIISSTTLLNKAWFL